MKRSISVLALVLCAVSFTFGQAQRAETSMQKPASATAKTSQPKFKAIWEPVNYKEDLTLFDVFFVSKEEGWVTGAAGTILHTRDGGTTWRAELGGDPQAQGGEIKNVFFKDAQHGWAQTWNVLFRTTDGESWQQMTGDIRGNVFFVSNSKGFRSTYDGTIFATEDGGVTWKKVFSCHAKMEVQGLMHDTDCHLWVLDFPTATVGYAMGDARITAKTEDGGATWTVLVGPEEPGDHRVYSVDFLNADFGYVISAGMYRTTDGGHNWQSVIAKISQGYPAVKFADREVGWSCLGQTWAYTVDGGNRWTTREVRFPTPVASFSLPARDRGYVVGDHGMIYRYRVVPVDYTSKGMMEAPMMGEPSLTPSSGN